MYVGLAQLLKRQVNLQGLKLIYEVKVMCGLCSSTREVLEKIFRYDMCFPLKIKRKGGS